MTENCNDISNNNDNDSDGNNNNNNGNNNNNSVINITVNIEQLVHHCCITEVPIKARNRSINIGLCNKSIGIIGRIVSSNWLITVTQQMYELDNILVRAVIT